MINAKDLLGIGIVILVAFLIVKSISKWVTEIRWKLEIKKEPKIKKLSSVEKEIASKELQKQIIDYNNRYYEKMFEGKEFINKNTTTLSKFIINSDINSYDLHKLAQLNGIKIEMFEGWNNLVLDLMIELDKVGWNRKVSAIKEKFGELRFYAEPDYEDIIEKYTEKSKTICDVCGNSGVHFNKNGWDYTRCDKH